MSFYTEVIQQDPRFNSAERVADLDLLEPITKAAVQTIVADAAGMGIELMVFETYRSQELQLIYYRRGATQLKNVGVHHYGLAADIVKVINGEPSWAGSFDFLQKLANKYGLVWGGDWGAPDEPHSFRDPVHVQRITVGDQAALFSGEWYPPPEYSPYE